MGGGRYAYGNQPTTADCCVFPTLYLVNVIGARFGRPAALTEHPRAHSYYQRVQEDPVIRRVLDEMNAAMQAAGYG